VERHLDKLAAAEEKDWHPGSGDKVLDLIHPSLYPYIKGVSQRVPLSEPMKYGPLEGDDKSDDEDKDKDEGDEDNDGDDDGDGDGDDDDDDGYSGTKRKMKMKSPAKLSKKKKKFNSGDDDDNGDNDNDNDNDNKEVEDRFGRPVGLFPSLCLFLLTEKTHTQIEKSKYQWLPAIYDVDANGKVQITSYINNLDRVVSFYFQIYFQLLFDKLSILQMPFKRNTLRSMMTAKTCSSWCYHWWRSVSIESIKTNP